MKTFLKRLFKSLAMAGLIFLFCAIVSTVIACVLALIGWALSLFIPVDGGSIIIIALVIIFFIMLVIGIYKEGI